MRMRAILGAGLLLMISVASLASGTLIYEQGSKASAQAGAFVARADDATAMWYNPAGMAFQKGMNFAVNLTYINADVKYKSPTLGEYTDNSKNFFLPGIYFTMPLTSKISFGVMANAPFNLSTDWSDTFPGRFASRHAKIVTTDIRPALSFRLDDHHAFAIGLDYYDSKVNLIRGLNTSALSTAINPNMLPSPPFPPGIPFYQYSEGDIDTWVRDQALGWDISYMYKSNEFSLGITYSSKANFSYNGHSSFETSPYIGPLASYFPGQETSLELGTVPAIASIGFAYTGNPLNVEFDANWVQWSSYGDPTVHFGTPTSFHGTPIVANETLPFEWKDTGTYRLGFSYKMSPNYELRWGLLYDQAPVPDKTLNPSLPDQDRWSVQFGSGYQKGGFTFDWYAMYLKFDNANITASNINRYGETGLPTVVVPVYGKLYPTTYPITPDGYYQGTAWLFGMQVGWKF